MENSIEVNYWSALSALPMGPREFINWLAACPVRFVKPPYSEENNPFSKYHPRLFNGILGEILEEELQRQIPRFSDGACITSTSHELYRGVQHVAYRPYTVESPWALLHFFVLYTLCFSIYGSLLGVIVPQNIKDWRVKALIRFFCEFCLLNVFFFLPFLPSSTIFIPILVLVLHLLRYALSNQQTRKAILASFWTDKIQLPRRSESGQLEFMSEERSIVTCIICVCVLAVDYMYFPRSWLKTAKNGVSLMDVGISAIVFSSCIIHKIARGQEAPKLKVKNITHGIYWPFMLGLIRLSMNCIMNKRDAEYGDHWNFFFTLTGFMLMTNIAAIALRRASYIFILGILLWIIYEVLILVYDVENLIWTNHRIATGFFWRNIAGILTTFTATFSGFVAIGIGRLLHLLMERKPEENSEKIKKGNFLVFAIGGSTIIVGILCFALGYISVILTPLIYSKLTCNFPWNLTLLGTNIYVLGSAITLEAVFHPKEHSVVAAGVNKNRLLIFVMANIGVAMFGMLNQTLLQPNIIGLLLTGVNNMLWLGLAYCLELYYMRNRNKRMSSEGSKITENLKDISEDSEVVTSIGCVDKEKGS